MFVGCCSLCAVCCLCDVVVCGVLFVARIVNVCFVGAGCLSFVA